MKQFNEVLEAQQAHATGQAGQTRFERDSEWGEQLQEQEKTSLQALQARAEAPIGVFDSGAGGLTILSALRQELPHENYIYFGDTGHCPYGLRSDAEIIELSISIGRFLIARGVKLIVVACNTASQAALSSLRATFSGISFIGVVPAVKPAARATRKGRIGIAATNQAAKAVYLRQLIDEFAGGIQAFAVGCPELVSLVERGQLDGPEVEEAVRQAFAPMLQADVDVIVLGCTHFPVLRPVIEHITGNSVQVIDSGSAIARRTHSVLHSDGLLSLASREQVNQMDHIGRDTQGVLQVWCSGDRVAFSHVASKILGYKVVAQRTDLGI